MTTHVLADRYGRIARDLRVSLTDRCNLRCTYCMPPEGVPWLPTADVLSDDEINRLVAVAVTRLGITKIRFTGGEPLLRPGLVEIVRAAAALEPRPVLSLTTNGIGLDRLAGPLREAGLDRVNVSLDTLDPERFFRLAHRRRLPDTLAGLAAAVEAGLLPVKINSVLVRGVNDDEAVPLLRFALAHGYQLRFIEQMPLDAGHTWSRDRMVTADEILTALAAEFTLRPDPVERGGAPAETWLVSDPGSTGSAGSTGSTGSTGPGSPARSAGPAGSARTAGLVGPDGAGLAGSDDADPAGTGVSRDGSIGAAASRVGVIASVTRPFCGDCDRTRLTADGQVRVCLFAREETDLRGLMRDGASDDELAKHWRVAMWGKLPGHGIDEPSFLQPTRPMSAIGG